MSPTAEQAIEIAIPGAEATVVLEQTSVRVSFHIDSGHLPPATRRDLVDSVFSLSQVKPGRVLHASVPIGDVELLDALRRRFPGLTVRPAGTTCLIEGVLGALP